MSLNRLALRLLTVAALRGRTLAGEAVRDSMLTPLDGPAGLDQPVPFLAVYTDDGVSQPKGRDLSSAGGTINLLIEFGVTAKMRFKLESGEDDEVLSPPPTDDRMELTLDVMERQIKIALADTANPFAELWRVLVSDVKTLATKRGAFADRGGRYAGRMLEIEVVALADPPFGAEPAGIWPAILAAFEGDARLERHVSLIRGLIVGAEPLPAWRVLQAQLGLASAEADSLLITPVAGAEEGDIAIVTVAPPDAGPTP
ncbi:MAG: hypothetical protein B7Z40_13490 [Bosea sp. 12-68-7]|nr:MAG: hypothetical protein B7Z40_13490 [Bosea sp. 12-68-7]OYX00810.1 MAG: hypothetical protein B7Z14_07945 [Bosea sp. 32-68-6]